jgi:hypothetical protein
MLIISRRSFIGLIFTISVGSGLSAREAGENKAVSYYGSDSSYVDVNGWIIPLKDLELVSCGNAPDFSCFQYHNTNHGVNFFDRIFGRLRLILQKFGIT